MPAPAVTKLGASTLNRNWRLDVNTGTKASPVWTPVRGRVEFQPALEPTLQDDSDFDSEGYRSQTSTALAWSLVTKVARKVLPSDSTAYDAGQEALRLAADGLGTDNSVHVRWYEMEPGGPRVEAYDGDAAVTWSPDGGGMDALQLVSVTLTGQGKRNAITHPDTV